MLVVWIVIFEVYRINAYKKSDSLQKKEREERILQMIEQNSANQADVRRQVELLLSRFVQIEEDVKKLEEQSHRSRTAIDQIRNKLNQKID